MSRAWRIEYEGALYHLMSRGNQQADIFYDDKDRQMMLQTLGEYSERFEIDIYAYVLMNNHYHLLVQTNRANLKRAMQWLGTTYTQRFNFRHFRSGHLFQGRYKSIIIENDAYLLQLSYYIHRNPLRAKLVKRLADYRWSSYRYYAYGFKAPEWLSTAMILSQHQGLEGPHKCYRINIQDYAKEEQALWEDFRHGLVLGSRQFVDKIKRKYLPNRPAADLPQQKRLSRTIDAEAYIVSAGRLIGFDINLLKRKGRLRGGDKDNRDILIYCLWCSGKLTNAQIGKLFAISYSAVSHAVNTIRTRMNSDKKLHQRIDTVNSQFKL